MERTMEENETVVEGDHSQFCISLEEVTREVILRLRIFSLICLSSNRRIASVERNRLRCSLLFL
ncbi:hypothetical protein F2Q69_00035722 [Brassica cretica]|uniref:Uncharacterized protein n=1 Tax=Brassica cretica TaxID=69181 RepID=A0A8S9SCX7_BRACR|nr:hypothetical protein F2Q69_00035722 [Brassica cretica]